MIYKEDILDHFKHPQNFGAVKRATHKQTGANASCGDRIKMSARIEEGKIVDIAFEGSSCALSTAAASMLTEAVKGRQVEEVLRWDGKEVEELTGEVNPGRVRCVTLPLRVLQKMLLKNE